MGFFVSKKGCARFISMLRSKYLKIVISVIVCVVVGGLSGYLTSGSISTWYIDLNKPVFNPPNWIFGPVWTTLYTLMGISSGIIWHQGIERKEVKRALIVFGVHLFLNFMWSILFFGLQQPLIAFVEILILLGFIGYFSMLFYRIKPATAFLQIPYMLWVSFATLLNGSIAWLN